jgi:cytoskeletal protein CcmA (bactofilin family)
VSNPDDPRGERQAGSGDDLLVELNALLGRGTRYAGKLHFTGRVRIEGHFEGEIRGEDVLVIGEGAEVVGDIQVAVCIVTGGSVRGNIRASDAIELHVPAVVLGDLHAPNIFIDRGVQFEGKCTMAPLDRPFGEDAPTLVSDARSAGVDGGLFDALTVPDAVPTNPGLAGIASDVYDPEGGEDR